jgi:hypothetical protein
MEAEFSIGYASKGKGSMGTGKVAGALLFVTCVS